MILLIIVIMECGTNVEYKSVPLIAGAGDQTLFTSFLTSLAQQLSREPMEWRR